MKLKDNMKKFMSFLLIWPATTAIQAIAIPLVLVGGYGLDLASGLYPLFSIMSLSAAAGVILHLFKDNQENKNTRTAASHSPDRGMPVIEATIADVRKAVRVYSEKLPKGVYRTILVKEDHSIDFTMLAPILKGIPSKKFFMSRETYDIFEENERDIAITLDKVQKAVDLYVKEYKQFPMLQYDPLNRVNYYQLIQAHCLDAQPDIELYITKYDGLVTHIKPMKNNNANR